MRKLHRFLNIDSSVCTRGASMYRLGWAPSPSHIADSDRAFVGKVINTYPVNRTRKEGAQITVFEVRTILTGRKSKKIKIYQPNYFGDSCAARFNNAAYYLVAAHRVNNKLTTDSHYVRRVHEKNIAQYAITPQTPWVVILLILIGIFAVSLILMLLKRRIGNRTNTC